MAPVSWGPAAPGRGAGAAGQPLPAGHSPVPAGVSQAFWDVVQSLQGWGDGLTYSLALPWALSPLSLLPHPESGAPVTPADAGMGPGETGQCHTGGPRGQKGGPPPPNSGDETAGSELGQRGEGGGDAWDGAPPPTEALFQPLASAFSALTSLPPT